MEDGTGNQWNGHDRRKGGWTMGREIVGTIIGCLPFVVMLIVWGSSIESRMTRHDTKIEQLERSDSTQERVNDNRDQETKTQLRRIEDKLDRVIEKSQR